MPPFAEPQDVANAWRPLTAAEESVATTLIGYASSILRGRFPDVDQRVADGKLSADIPQLAVVNMVIRVLRNPDGVRSESIDDYSISYSDVTLAGLELTAAEVALLAPSGAKSRPRQIRTAPGLWPS